MALFPNLRNRQGFFSDYYLGTVFGRASGRQRTLVTREIETAYRTLRRLHDRAEGRALDAPLVRDMFARPLLRDVLGFHVGAGDRRVHPLYASADDEAAGRPPLLLAYIGDWDEDPDAGRNSPHRMLAELLARATADLRYGILVTGERLRLIRRKGDGPAGACVELDLPACLEADDRESFAAAWRLFSARNFTHGPNGELPIQAIERESREHAEKVSENLKRAVFQAAETLVQALIADRTAHAEGPTRDPAAISPGELETYRDAALTCLYRILFILYAEARDERLLGHALYRDSYSLDGLVRDFLNNRMVPSPNRFGLWERLRALFAIHHGGLPAINGLERIPARGGDLFDPATPPGRLLEEVRLDDATVARLLLDLATTTARRGVGYERVSFRELDIEQLGAVYEGLLEFEPRIAAGTTLEVRVQGRTYALAPAELVRLCREKKLTLTGDATLVEGTEAEALRPRADLEATEDNSNDDDEEASEDEETAEEENGGVRHGASAVLVRRLERGQFHFVPGPGRKGSGSFYTPLPLVQDLVRHALGPLVEGRTAAEIESLRVLDPACGSAHFLVEAMRFLGQALHRAYVREHDGKAPPHFRPTGRGWDAECEASDEEARASGSEARAWCKRRIAERCLFGVDLNPTAVNLARVSLWIESLAGDRPLTYFEHHVRCGNSILGTWLDRLGSPPLPDLGTGLPPAQMGLFAEKAKEQIREAARIRRLIDLAADAGAVEPDTLEELRFKEEQRRQAEALLADARLLFDLRSASAFLPEIWTEREVLLGLLGESGRLASYVRSRSWWQRFEEIRARERFFHWELEFPEAFLNGRSGFDAVLTNPPWGTEPIRRYVRALLPEYRYISGRRDSFAFFVERAIQLARHDGMVGLVLPDIVLLKDYRSTRELILRMTSVKRIVHWGQVFEEANIDVCTMLMQRTELNEYQLVQCLILRDLSWESNVIPQARFLDQPKFKINLVLTDHLAELITELEHSSRPFSSLFESHEGVHSGNIRSKLFTRQARDVGCRPLLFGRNDIRPFLVSWSGWYIRLGEFLINRASGEYANVGRPEYFERRKLVIRRTGDRIVAALDSHHFYVTNNFFVAFVRDDIDEIWLHVAELILNSSLATWYFRAIQPRAGRLFAELKLEHLRLVPLPRSVNRAFDGRLGWLSQMIHQYWERNPNARDLMSDIKRELDECVFDMFDLDASFAGRLRTAVARGVQE